MKLTKSVIAAAQPQAKPYWLADGSVPGLGLTIMPSGTRTWYYRYRTATGRQRTLKLGRFPGLTPDDARARALDAHRDVMGGDDPAAARQDARKAPTIAELAARYQAEHPKAGPNQDAQLRLYILPVLGNVRVADLTKPDVHRWFTGLRCGNATANRCAATLSMMFTLAERWGWRPENTNPCRAIGKRPETPRRRYMTREEFLALDAALDAFGTHGARWRFAQLVRLLMLTGCRLREVMNAPWSAWSGDVLAVESKTGPREVVLPAVAQSILQAMRAADNHGSWIVRGTGDKPLVGYKKLWREVCATAGVRNLRIHDLRHSFASQGLSQGLSLPEIGELLGHRSALTTKRYAHLIDSRARAAVELISNSYQGDKQSKSPDVRTPPATVP